MSVFSGIEKNHRARLPPLDRRVFGPADSDQLLLVHRAILEEIETKIPDRGARAAGVFPYPQNGGDS